jgi:hypothetical protein
VGVGHSEIDALRIPPLLRGARSPCDLLFGDVDARYVNCATSQQTLHPYPRTTPILEHALAVWIEQTLELVMTIELANRAPYQAP